MPEFSKKELNYRMAEDKLKQCSKCGNFMDPDRCRLLGKVEPPYTCDAWQVAGAPGAVEDALFGLGGPME